MKPVYLTCLVLLIFYVLLVLVVYFFQAKIVFQGRSLPPDYVFQFDTPFEEVNFNTADGASINALFFPAAQISKGAILYLHGNRGNLVRWGKEHAGFNRLGYDCLFIDYRGYGKSTGQPSEEGLYQDAEAAYQWLADQYPTDSIILYGRSLGSGVAAYLAQKYPARLAILETPYNNIPDLFQSKVLVPLPRSAYRISFPTDVYLKGANMPVYVLAGERDQLILLQLSERLRPLLSSAEHFWVIAGAGHRNLSDFPSYWYHLSGILETAYEPE